MTDDGHFDTSKVIFFPHCKSAMKNKTFLLYDLYSHIKIIKAKITCKIILSNSRLIILQSHDNDIHTKNKKQNFYLNKKNRMNPK